MRYLKLSTQVVEMLGCFVDKTDGVTEEAGLAGTGTEISKAGAAFGAGPVLGTYDSDGYYPVTLTTTHTNTLGSLVIKVNDAATHLPVWHEFTVVSAAFFDWICGSTIPPVNTTQWLGTACATPTVNGVPEVDITHIGGTAVTAAAGIPEVKVASVANNAITAAAVADAAIDAATFAADTGMTVVRGNTCQNGGSTTTAVLDAGASAQDGFYIGDDIRFTAGTGVGYQRVITGYVGATKTATFAPAIVGSPDNTSVFVITAKGQPNGVQGDVTGNVTGSVASVGGLTAATVHADLDDIQARLPAALGANGNMKADVRDVNGAAQTATLDTLKTDTAAILTDTGTTLDGRIPAALVGGRMDASVGAVAAGVDLSATMKTSVNAEVVDALNVDTYAEVGQEAPAATTTLTKMLRYLYKAFRNKKTQTATTFSLYADDATTVDQKATTSDDGTTGTVGEIASGP